MKKKAKAEQKFTRLIPRQGEGVNYCQGCRKHLVRGQCEVLGPVNDEALKICKARGYADHRRADDVLYRVFDNRRGAL